MSNNVDDGVLTGEEPGAIRLSGLLAEDALSLDLVSALAGDRVLTDAEKALLEEIRKSRGERFYPDLIYAVAHQYYPAEVAEKLWHSILQHKYYMSSTMKRNIRITVAALDYLSNLTSAIPSATVISEAHIAELIRLSMRDGLTGLYNHACCFQRLEAELERFERYGTPVSLMMIDIDDFKTINDTFGHPEGDRVLADLGAALDKHTRDADICCRYGGEEFAVILPSTGAQEAAALAERLRAGIEQCRPGQRLVTVSIGVATCSADARSATEVVMKADAALYRAKEGGKNRVVVGA